MSVPIEAKTFTFTPDLLKGKEGAPIFTLRYGTRRDKHAYRAEMAARGVTYYPEHAIRRALLDEIRRIPGNTKEVQDRVIDAVERMWANDDARQIQIKEWLQDCEQAQLENPDAELPPPPVDEFDHDERAQVTGIIMTVQSQSPTIGEMRRANSNQEFDGGEAALAVVLVSAEGFDLERRPDGLIGRDCLARLEEWLGDLAENLGVDVRDADGAYIQLCNVGFNAFYNPKEVEKNFASPPQPSSQEDSSKVAEPGDTISTDSAKSTSKKTRSEADTTEDGTSANSPSAAEMSTDGSNGPMAEPSLTSPAG